MKKQIIFSTLFLILIMLLAFLAAHILTGQHNAGKSTAGITRTTSIPAGQHSPSTITGVTTYIYGSKLVASKNNAITYHYQDMLSSNTLTTNQAGVLQSRYTAYPYGKTLSKGSTSGGAQKYTFTGKEDDGKISYFGARYLDYRTGRFVSTDPVQSGDSTYQYAKDNPLIFNDPDGKAAADAGEISPFGNTNTGVDHYLTTLPLAYLLSDALKDRTMNKYLREALATTFGQITEIGNEIRENYQYTRPMGMSLKDQFTLPDTKNDIAFGVVGGIVGAANRLGVPVSLQSVTFLDFQHKSELRLVGEDELSIKTQAGTLQPFLARGVYSSPNSLPDVHGTSSWTGRSFSVGASTNTVKGPYVGAGLLMRKQLKFSQGGALVLEGAGSFNKGTGSHRDFFGKGSISGGIQINDWTKLFSHQAQEKKTETPQYTYPLTD